MLNENSQLNNAVEKHKEDALFFTKDFANKILKKFNLIRLEPKYPCNKNERDLITRQNELSGQSFGFEYNVIPELQEETNNRSPDDSVVSSEVDKEIDTDEVQETESIRSVFPDVWIYDNFLLSNASTFKEYDVPDSITKWKLTGISINPDLGVAFAKPKFVRVTKSFYIRAYGPKAVKPFEFFKVNVFTNRNAKVCVLKTNEFEFKSYDRNSDEERVENVAGHHQEDENFYIFTLSDKGEFLIRALNTTSITLNVVANSGGDKDKVQLTVNVINDELV